MLTAVEELIAGFDREGFKRSQQERPQELRGVAAAGQFLLQAEALTPFVVAGVERFRPDVIYRDYMFHAGSLAGLVTGVPVATFAFFPLSPGQVAARSADRYLQAIDAVGGRGGLESLDQGITGYGLPSSWFGSARPAGNAHLVQPAEAPATDDGTARELLAGLSERPTVYATRRTEFNRPDVWREIFDGVAALDVNVIATTGASMQHGTVAVPSNVRVGSFVPQQHLLPHCDAVIGHGGYGTLMGALRRGVPVASIPAAATDNLPNAIRKTLANSVVRPPVTALRGPVVFRGTVASRHIRDRPGPGQREHGGRRQCWL